jgi:hypothetical protein
MVPPSVKRRCSHSLAFFILSATLVLASCSPEPASRTTLPPPQAYEKVTNAVRDLVLVAENVLEVRTGAGGYSSSGGDLFIDYFLSGEPCEPDEAASKLKQELEALGAGNVEVGVIEGGLLVDFDQLPLGEYVWEGFIQVYEGHLFGYLNRVSSGS